MTTISTLYSTKHVPPAGTQEQLGLIRQRNLLSERPQQGSGGYNYLATEDGHIVQKKTNTEVGLLGGPLIDYTMPRCFMLDLSLVEFCIHPM